MKDITMTDQKATMDTTDNSSAFYRTFVEHPASVDESYLQHAWFATRFASTLFAAGFAALIHAIIPSLFESTASRMIANMHERLQNRH